MTLTNQIWSRLIVCVLSVVFLLLYSSQYSNHRQQYGQIMRKYSQSIAHANGLVAQLHVMIERNQRVEKLMSEMQNKHNLIMKETLEKYRKLESIQMSCLQNARKCDEQSKALRSLNADGSEAVRKNEETIGQLKELLKNTEAKLNDKSEQLKSSLAKISDLKSEKTALSERLQRIEYDFGKLKLDKEECLVKIGRNVSKRAKSIGNTAVVNFEKKVGD